MNDHPQNPWEQNSSSGGQGWQQAPPTNQWAQQPPQPQYQQYQQPTQSKGWLWILLAIALAVIIATVGVAGWLFGWFGGSGSQASGPVTSTFTSTVQVAPGEQAQTPTTEPRERERERGEQAVPSGSIPANSAARDNAPTGDFNSVWRGTTVTSEPFANAVRDAFVRNYLDTGDTDATLRVFSSVTGQTYTMTCRDNGSYVTCTGGNNAVVHIS
ncbi:MAG: hypothetical protein Q4G50_06610 [Corynebacterium sp.]|uniref:hypothetical protein n=1 Tax=Corynebacterium sp. TaxID=1720 RepID=UPI0026E0E24C|nr:hypothetical protein [Corynebacterium sp.]MDO5669657.1 hypothetical protein [Corynebacterium sp.]